MVITMMPVTAFATGETDGSDNTSEVHVEIENMLLRTNQPAKLKFTVNPEDMADQITFAAAEECADDLRVYENNGVWYAGYQRQGIKEGTTGTINALYNGEIVGTCKVLFHNLGLNGNMSNITYKAEDGTELTSSKTTSMPFATPTSIHVSIPELSLENISISGWEWITEGDAEVFDAVPDTNDSSKVVVTFYQSKSGNYRIAAVPTIRIDGTEYIYNYASTRRISYSKDVLTSNNVEAIYQGGSVTLTYNLPESVSSESVDVVWSSSNEEVLKLDQEDGKQASFVAPEPSPISGRNIAVTVTASAEINGNIYSGTKEIWVWKKSVAADATVDTWETLVSAIKAGDETININNTIEIPENENLDLTGITLLRPDSFSGALFNINAKGVSITSDGTGIIEGQYNNAQAPLVAVVRGGELTVNNIIMQNAVNIGEGGNSQGGAISVEGGDLTCTDVKFINNTATGNSADSNYYNGGGAIYSENSEINITDCELSDNEAIFGNGGTIYADQGTTGYIRNSKITNSEAQKTSGDTDGFGGAIYCRLAGEMMISGNIIDGCRSDNDGGGIAILTTTGDGIGKITLAGNEICNNISSERGGGLYLVQDKPDTIDLQSGIISGNSAAWGGGIDYTVHSQEALILQDVLITGNTAVRGAGIWACPTSETESYTTLGGAIYGNNAIGSTQGIEPNPIDASGDDIRYEGKDADKHREDLLILQGKPWVTDTTNITVMKRALGGGVMQWYQDEQNDRYESGDTEANTGLYTNTDQSFGLHGELSEEHQKLAESEARLIIKNNTAESRGGGIASNSPIQVGMKDADMTVTVTKKWNDEDHQHPESVLIDLYRVDASGERVRLDSNVSLNAENNWSKTFTDLPSLYIDEDGEQQPYDYEIEEQSVKN